MNMVDRIKQRMLELDINQEELGKAAGLTQPAIFKLLSGKTRRTTRLTEIAKALKVRPEWLVDGADPMTPGNITDEDKEMINELLTLEPEKRQIIRMTIRAMLPSTGTPAMPAYQLQAHHANQARRLLSPPPPQITQ